ncbi:hypothetical protein PC116_g14810 [Phytophthora cactorum]|uniref:Uncharacterized protein n=2 Tax=Phytophthora cactorum TaxID=29920 RepID=A0A329S9J7_9STRA|nr:hypothetical protein Pcac1_g10014 [Phytophthora cactorum]KAG2919093.1 hypothetical protein PC115_g10260 [Phytophthora cactorum]KAG4237108.1 hypothetical protein PC116_g14810 [Phytophthora cactorum]RAW33300.1 hypothetical protein PC110_g10361 [Phytophthora cactorum]
MRSLHRILLERKTRRFVDQMIHKYSDIRLAATTRAMARKRSRIEVNGVRKACGKPPVNQEHDRGDYSDVAAELSTSSCCRTESDRSSRLSSTMLDIERSQTAKGHERQQQQEEAQLDRWRMSEAPTVSEYGSASSTRLARLLEDEGSEFDNQENQESMIPRSATNSSLEASIQQEMEENQERLSLSACDSSSTNPASAPASTQSSVGNQIEEHSQLSERSIESPPTSSTTETLPRLQPTAPAHCVVPNCCDYFTSPHPHYPKEVIGKAHKVEEPLNTDPSQTSSTSLEAANEAANNESNCHAEGRNDDQANISSRGGGDSDEFEMWDYVCPQYARRGYANEWV